MRRRLLRMWLALALRAMERAAGFSAELLSDRHLDDLALAYRILYRAVMGRPDDDDRRGLCTGGALRLQCGRRGCVLSDGKQLTGRVIRKA